MKPAGAGKYGQWDWSDTWGHWRNQDDWTLVGLWECCLWYGTLDKYSHLCGWARTLVALNMDNKVKLVWDRENETLEDTGVTSELSFNLSTYLWAAAVSRYAW